MILWPLIALIAWGVSVLNLAAENDSSTLPGICILLVGFALYSWILGFLYIRFNNFKLSWITLGLLFLGTGKICMYN